MSGATHTPGPWFVSRKHEVGPRSKEDDQSNGMIVPLADVYGDNRNQDAILIAAAPELLEACRQALGCDLDPATNALIRAAIAKAEGRTNA